MSTEARCSVTLSQDLPDAARITLGADKAYDTHDFVAACRAQSITPHVAQNARRRSSATGERTSGHPGYEISQRVRKRIEEFFGWMKTVGDFRKARTADQYSVRNGSFQHAA